MSKRPTRNPADDQNWTLACRVCGEHFPDTAALGMVQAHMQIVHDASEGAELELDLVWLGLGPAPKSRPS